MKRWMIHFKTIIFQNFKGKKEETYLESAWDSIVSKAANSLSSFSLWLLT